MIEARHNNSAWLRNKKDRPWLIVLFAIVTGYNLFKPYHVDDAAHLIIAQWIAANPLHPMSGNMNWSGVDEPIWHTNQPHLYFYLMAIWGRIAGYSEPAMHALHSLSSLACIGLFYRLAKEFRTPSTIWACAMLALGPAFIVDQNMMVDTPLLATWLVFFNLLIIHKDSARQTRRYLLAGLVCGAALLIKYSSLVLFPILCISLLLEGRRPQAWTALIPLVILAIWSGFNYADYGGIHIATRPVSAGHNPRLPLEFAISWVIGLGAVTPLGLVLLAQWRRKHGPSEDLVYPVAVAALACLALAVATGAVSDKRSDALLWMAFLANGAAICWPLMQICKGLLRDWLKDHANLIRRLPQTYLLLWLIGASAFYILFSPFIAARHVLLILPPVLLLISDRLGPNISKTAMTSSLALTIAISAGLCISDWRFAAFHRSEAEKIARSLPQSATIWTTGHLAWQWYAQNAGFRQVDVERSRLRAGDYLLVPDQINAQLPMQRLSLRHVRTDISDRPILNLFCTGRGLRFYVYNYRIAPWSISRACQNQIQIFRVISASPP